MKKSIWFILEILFTLAGLAIVWKTASFEMGLIVWIFALICGVRGDQKILEDKFDTLIDALADDEEEEYPMYYDEYDEEEEDDNTNTEYHS